MASRPETTSDDSRVLFALWRLATMTSREECFEREEIEMTLPTSHAAQHDAVVWLRRSYWTGAAVDALATLSWLGVGVVPEPRAIRPALDVRSDELRYGLRCGAALMAGWTALLLWADRAPLERKGVLPLTVFPVIAGLAAADAAALRAGQLPRARVIPVRIVQATLACVFAYSYSKAARATRR